MQSPSRRAAAGQHEPPNTDNDLTTFEMAEFPLPPSSAGSRSPSTRSPYQQHLSPYASPQLSNVGFQSPPQIYHTPPQDIRSPYTHHNATSIARGASPKPLYLPSWNYNATAPAWETRNGQNMPRGSPQLARPMQSFSPARSQQHTGDRLLPSPMPQPTADNPFHEDSKKPSSFSPPDTANTDDTFPPTSPNDSIDSVDKGTDKDSKKKNKKKKPIGPAPLFKPSIALLFSLSTKNDKLTLLLPAMIFSIAAGVVPPLMTFVLGEAFDLFTAYQTALSYQSTLPKSLQDMQNANSDLKNGMIKVAIALIILGILAVVLTTAALWLWVWHGERVAKRLRYTVFVGVSKKPMAWFDLGMGKRIGEAAGTSGSEQDDESTTGENESSGGLMGRFTRYASDSFHYFICSGASYRD